MKGYETIDRLSDRRIIMEGRDAPARPKAWTIGVVLSAARLLQLIKKILPPKAKLRVEPVTDSSGWRLVPAGEALSNAVIALVREK